MLNKLLVVGAASTVPSWLTVGLAAWTVYDLFSIIASANKPNKAGLLNLDLNTDCQRALADHVDATTVFYNFEDMETMYNRYGERGVYAYLIENRLVHDFHHGQFVIKDLFLPELARRRDAM